jgi:Fe-S-cluster containining protein
MKIKSNLEALNRVYEVYDAFSSTLDLACKEKCAHCCTSNVTLTTLEGYKIVADLIAAGKLDVIDRLKDTAGGPRFQPLLTANRMAELCAAEAKVPQEDTADEWQDCALLIDSLCTIYDLRPFGCRCFVSRKNCGETGYADIDDFTASVNTVFLQVIEHLDAEGCSGNLIDLLPFMASENNRRAYEKGELNCEDNGLIVNWELKVLMIPPEHRARIEPILQQLREIHHKF